MEENKRIHWLDIAKLLLIVLVIVGHTKGDYDSFLYKCISSSIFSFHMPCFFIISGLTYNFSNDLEEYIHKTKKAFIKLIIPVLICFFISSIISFFHNSSFVDFPSFLKDSFLTLIYSNGIKIHFVDLTVNEIGMTWFLIVLFFSRQILDFLQLKIKNEAILGGFLFFLSSFGIVIGKHFYLPFSFDLVLSVLPFIYIGKQIKKVDFSVNVFAKACYYFVLWIISFIIIAFFSNTYLELATRSFPLFPLCYFCSFFGSMSLLCFSFLFDKFINIYVSKSIQSQIYFLAKNTLSILIIHSLDMYWIGIFYSLFNGFIYRSLIRIFINFLVFIFVNKVYNLLKYLKMKIL